MSQKESTTPSPRRSMCKQPRLCLGQLDALWVPIIKTWRLNERMYVRRTCARARGGAAARRGARADGALDGPRG